MSNKDAEEVKEGLEEAMSSGLLLNYPLLDIKVTLLEGKRHMVDTKPGDFKNAAVLAFRGDGVAEKEKRIQEMGVVLLEPIMQVEVIIPKDYIGDVLANLGSRRTIIENTEEKEGESYITGKTPLKEILNYSTTLRQLTKGRGTYSMYLSHYQEVPAEVLAEILKEEKFKEKGETSEEFIRKFIYLYEDYTKIVEQVKDKLNQENSPNSPGKSNHNSKNLRISKLDQEKKQLEREKKELEEKLAEQGLGSDEKKSKELELDNIRRLLEENGKRREKLNGKGDKPVNSQKDNIKLN
ncbi:4926_t:CDS:2 [Paraglomus brasilianum]|uniref:4926_t:CDS:1 n=1 Tax=Paraglomus brasilianum TaxID=144538 RepID=A0A9N9CGD3_9GLOM|nr:4926_t:CDS:2 [Paraglomus brasilianum]